MRTQQLKDRMAGRKKRKHIKTGFGDYTFDFMRNNQLLDTESGGQKFLFRLMPDNSEKCVYGFRFYSIHEIEMKKGDEENRAVLAKVLGRESYEDPDTAKAPAMIDELLDLLDDEVILSEVDKQLGSAGLTALGRLEARVSTWWPSIWHLEPTPVLCDDGETRTKYKPAGKEVRPVGKIWVVTAQGLFDALMDLKDEDALLNHHLEGRYLKLSKSGYNCTITPELQSSELDPRTSSLRADYPPMDKMGTKHKRSPEEIWNLLEKSWWFPTVAEIAGIGRP